MTCHSLLLASDLAEDAQDIRVPDMELQEASVESLAQANDRASDMSYELDNPELCLEDCDSEGWDDIEMDDAEDGDGDGDEAPPDSSVLQNIFVVEEECVCIITWSLEERFARHPSN